MGHPDSRQRWLAAGVMLSGLFTACGQGPVAGLEDDAGVAVNDSGLIATPPDIPWLDVGLPPIAAPMLTPCPDGWHEVVEERPEGGPAAVHCDPYSDPSDSSPTEKAQRSRSPTWSSATPEVKAATAPRAGG